MVNGGKEKRQKQPACTHFPSSLARKCRPSPPLRSLPHFPHNPILHSHLHLHPHHLHPKPFKLAQNLGILVPSLLPPVPQSGNANYHADSLDVVYTITAGSSRSELPHLHFHVVSSAVRTNARTRFPMGLSGAEREKAGHVTLLSRIGKLHYACTILLGVSIFVYYFFAFSIGVFDCNNAKLLHEQHLHPKLYSQQQHPPWLISESPTRYVVLMVFFWLFAIFKTLHRWDSSLHAFSGTALAGTGLGWVWYLVVWYLQLIGGIGCGDEEFALVGGIRRIRAFAEWGVGDGVGHFQEMESVAEQRGRARCGAAAEERGGGGESAAGHGHAVPARHPTHARTHRRAPRRPHHARHPAPLPAHAPPQRRHRARRRRAPLPFPFHLLPIPLRGPGRRNLLPANAHSLCHHNITFETKPIRSIPIPNYQFCFGIIPMPYAMPQP